MHYLILNDNPDLREVAVAKHALASKLQSLMLEVKLDLLITRWSIGKFNLLLPATNEMIPILEETYPGLLIRRIGG